MTKEKTAKRARPLVLAASIGCLLTAFLYPRFIIHWLGAASPWASYFYQYGLGLVVFLIGIWLILATGACQPGRGHDRFWLGVLLGGFVFFAALHAIWILAALHLPFYGGAV